MSHEKVTETFDSWADSGRDAGMEEGHGDVVRQVLDSLSIQPGEKILELGCGNGWATRLLAQANAGVQAIGVDASPKMIGRADELHSFTIRARYEHGRFEELDFGDAAFDRIFSMEALYYSTDVSATLAECFRVLKPGGHIDVVIDFYKESPATECWARIMGLPLQWKGEAEWRAAFETAGFTQVETSRVVDSRGPGPESDFEPSECYPDWETYQGQCEAGSLRISAIKP